MAISRTFCLAAAILAAVAGLWGAAAPGEAARADGFMAEDNGIKYYAASNITADAGVSTVWIKLVPGEPARERIADQRRAAGLAVGSFKDLDYILCRVTEGATAGQIVISEQIYIDSNGETVGDWIGPDWSAAEPPAELVAAGCREFLTKYFTTVRVTHTQVAPPPTGFGGFHWGILPQDVPGAKYLANVESGSLAQYAAEVDAAPLLGAVPAQITRLVFNKQQGLISGSLYFDGGSYDVVLAHLTELLGPPEKKPNHKYYWLIPGSTAIELAYRPGLEKGVVAAYELQFWLQRQQH